MPSKLPNFFIVGAPKAGTTSLSNYLDQHPHVYMSAIKEPNFFSVEIREENFEPEHRRRLALDRLETRRFLAGPMREKRFGGIVDNWEDYQRLFANATDQIALGEASVSYLWSPSAAEQIATRIPDAKIIVMLRDPADRAFSQYLHGVSMGAIRWTFREHIERSLRHASRQLCVYFPFLEYGLYFQQLRRYLDLFGKNVWIGFQGDFKNRPLVIFHDICRFLAISPEFSPNMEKRHLEAQVPRTGAVGRLRSSGLWEAAARITPSAIRPLIRRGLMRKPGKPTPSDRQLLLDYYREDINNLATLLNRDLGSWLH